MSVVISHCSDKEISKGEEGEGIGTYSGRDGVPWKRSNCIGFGISGMFLTLDKNSL